MAQTTHIGEAAIRQFAVPLVLHLRNLACLVEDQDLALDRLLLVDALDDIARLHVHLNGVAGAVDLVAETFNFGEGGLEAIPLWLILLAAFGLGDGVLEYGVIFPKTKLRQRRAASEEVEDGADESSV